MDNLTPPTIPSHTYVSDKDPNAQKNRIPTDAELSLLQSLEKSHSALFEHIKEQVKTAQATHDAILARYELQFRELEGTQSQLHESKKALHLMQDQCSRLHAESRRLSGITHPIRRYPSDVLQYIFESTCDLVSGSKKIQTGFTLSHVCQRWRAIAHDSPRLWSQIEYKMKRDSSKISSFWNHIIPKLKAVPVAIVIRSLEGNVDKRLEACNLAQIPKIDTLTFHLTANRFFIDLLSPAAILPNNEIQSLGIVAHQTNAAVATESDTIWDIGLLMEEWPIAPTVLLNASCILRITPSDNLGNITTLRLKNLKQVDVLLVLLLLNQLEQLCLENVDVTPPSTTAVQTVSASLKSLLVNTDDQGELWLPLISCPSLIAFHHAGPGFSETCIAFVALHVSILVLDYVSEGNLVPIIAPIAPQLQSLSIEPTNIPDLYKWKTNGALVPPFPSLKELKISVTISTISVVDFDAIVQMYCLRVSHEGGEPLRSSTSLNRFSVLVDKKEDTDDDGDGDGDEASWRTSELYQRAIRTLSQDEIWAEFDVLDLSWASQCSVDEKKGLE